jgi:probable phosphoglycerate mutase
MGEIVLLRHGQTEWSASGRHTSYTDLDLTDEGERQARELGQALAARRFAAVLTSPRRRAYRTAELAGLVVTRVEDDLREWDYGEYEGVTTAQIREHRPDWNLWTDGCPGGEFPGQVGDRIDRVLAAVAPLLPTGDVVLCGHGHASRVAGARWVGLPAPDGGRLRLDTGSVSLLGHEHGRPVIVRWNSGASALSRAGGR